MDMKKNKANAEKKRKPFESYTGTYYDPWMMLNQSPLDGPAELLLGHTFSKPLYTSYKVADNDML